MASDIVRSSEMIALRRGLDDADVRWRDLSEESMSMRSERTRIETPDGEVSCIFVEDLRGNRLDYGEKGQLEVMLPDSNDPLVMSVDKILATRGR